MISENKTIKLIFDGSILRNYLYKNSSRSGILFVSINILKELAKYSNLEISIFYPYCSYNEIKKLQDLDIIPSNCSIIKKEIMTNFCIDFLLNVKPKIQKTEKDSFIKKILRFTVNRLLSFYNSRLEYNKKLKHFVNSNDVFISICDPIPNIIRNNPRIKHYIMIHDLIPLVMKDFYGEKYKDRISGMENVIKSLKPKDKIFTVSEYTKTDILNNIKNLDSNDITVTPIAADSKIVIQSEDKIKNIKEKYGINNDKKYIFSLCTLEPRKNLIFSIKNFISFIDKYNINDLVFVIAGAPWKEYSPVIDDAVMNIKHNNSIIRLGYLEDDDVSALYSGAVAFVYPSLYEGFGMPVLEAMQCGCPVITSNVSSLPEVIGEAGIQVNPHSDAEMVSAYEKIFFDTDFRQACVKKGLERAKIFSWEKSAKIIYETFCEDMNL